jgi:hypothetical protein
MPPEQAPLQRRYNPKKGAVQANAPFLAKRTGRPLWQDVLCEAIQRRSYTFAVSETTWEILKELDAGLEKPTRNAQGMCKTRKRMLGLVEEAAGQGNFDILRKLYRENLLKLSLSRVFCFLPNRENAYAALLNEAGGRLLTREFYEECCLPQLLPWEAKIGVERDARKKAHARRGLRTFPFMKSDRKLLGCILRTEKASAREWQKFALMHEKIPEKFFSSGMSGSEFHYNENAGKTPKPDQIPSKGRKKPAETPGKGTSSPKELFARTFSKEEAGEIADFDLAEAGAGVGELELVPPLQGPAEEGGQKAEPPPMLRIARRREELEKGVWTPDTVVEKDEAEAVLACWEYFNRELKGIGYDARVVVEIKAGNRQVTYRTDAAELGYGKLPLYEISLDIVNRDGTYTFRGEQKTIYNEDLRDIVEGIVFSSQG